jgi:ubiquinone biosynthesis protein Coq4
VLGEVALKWVEMVQTGLPVAAFSGLFGPLALDAGACVGSGLGGWVRLGWVDL